MFILVYKREELFWKSGDGVENTGLSQPGQSPGKEPWAERGLLKDEMH